MRILLGNILFANPALAIGVFALGVPLLIHLLTRRTPKNMIFLRLNRAVLKRSDALSSVAWTWLFDGVGCPRRHPPQLRPFHAAGVCLSCTRSTPAVLDVLSEQGLQCIHNPGMLVVHVPAFPDIGGQVVELNGRQAFAFLPGARIAPTA